MKKFSKICSVIINILFSLGLIYYTLFNSLGLIYDTLFNSLGIRDERLWYPESEFLDSMLDSLFFEEYALGAVFFFEGCLAAAAVLTLIFCRKGLPKPVKGMLYCGFAFPVIMLYANDMSGWDNIAINIWLAINTLFYLTYFIVFQILFWKSFKNAQ